MLAALAGGILSTRPVAERERSVDAAVLLEPLRWSVEVGMASVHGGRFTAILFRYPGKGGWYFAPVPNRLAPPVTHGWGRTPVEARVDGVAWNTSVWRGKDGRTLLAVPAKVRGANGDGDRVQVELRFNL